MREKKRSFQADSNIRAGRRRKRREEEEKRWKIEEIQRKAAAAASAVERNLQLGGMTT